MPFKIEPLDDGVVVLRISGEFKKSEMDRMQAAALTAINRRGKIRVLVELEGFRGWEQNPGWGDVAFMQEQGRNIEKMAIVGDEAWRDLVEAFTGKGFRATVIEYFSPSERDRALSWLGNE